MSRQITSNGLLLMSRYIPSNSGIMQKLNSKWKREFWTYYKISLMKRMDWNHLMLGRLKCYIISSLKSSYSWTQYRSAYGASETVQWSHTHLGIPIWGSSEETQQIEPKQINGSRPNPPQNPQEISLYHQWTICTALWTFSLQTGTILRSWKRSHVGPITPIFKKSDKQIAGDCRPVTLTSISEFMESLVREDTMNQMATSHLVSKHQFDLVHGRSTVLQLLHVQE